MASLSIPSQKVTRALQIFRLIRNYSAVYSHLILRTRLQKILLRNGIRISSIEGVALWRHFHDIWIFEVYTREVNPIRCTSVVIDIGASIGLFSLYAASRGALIYSFEPDGPSFHCLERNIRDNPKLQISAEQVAIMSSEDRRTLHQSPQRTGNSLYPKSRSAESPPVGEPVECKTLESVFANHSIQSCDCLKMNCEGSEYEILFSTPEPVLRRIKFLTIECHDTLTSFTHKDLLKYLKSAGFVATVSLKRRDDTVVISAIRRQSRTGPPK